ncbi:MAG: aminomethyl-transferring glycine dehydrogenase [Pseudomonadota bacterium]
MNSQIPVAVATLLPRLCTLQHKDEFTTRHVGPDAAQTGVMLQQLGLKSLEDLIAATVPAAIALGRPLDLPAPLTEPEALFKLKSLLAHDKPARSFIGMGYYDTFTPNVILRNVLENPGWYTAYTPYQPEISQGRLECLLNFQQMVMDLTGMDLATASLLDEATAAAEAMALAKRVCGNAAANTFFVDHQCFPQTIDVIKTRAHAFGFDVVVGDPATISEHAVFGAIFQYPALRGDVQDLGSLIAALHAQKAIAIVAADILGLALLKSPGEMGADVVVGSTQRFGVPMGYGGPHAAYFATRQDYRRSVPGRMIGVSVDSRGKQALRMALQTREQHIRREKANSNICTAQVLLANVAALYAMYHGPVGLKRIANRVHRLTAILALGLQQAGSPPLNETFFDTITLELDAETAAAVLVRAEAAGINLRMDNADGTRVGISLDECTTPTDVELLWQVILGEAGRSLSLTALDQAIAELREAEGIGAELQRSSDFLTHAHFNSYHSETEMLRYMKKLEDRDISLNRSMIALGSCTMKLNATAEMMPISWPELNRVHPFVPKSQVPGYQQMISDLENMLMAITGFDAVCMQPNSGAQGEYAGLLAIRNYLDSLGQQQRNVCLIPSSAHGTNPATAQMVGMKVVIVACDARGNVDVNDLRAKALAHAADLAALMITYPSTHGVFEESIREICTIIHTNGGQVYMDGANLNAQVGVSRPADIGADVSHVNLHKTFCIPHGGGGPGMGPIGMKAHLAPFMAGHVVVPPKDVPLPFGAVSAAPWGSASILPISWMYVTMMGASGLLKATQVAILNANYVARKLDPHFPVLYTGSKGMVAHECIIDLRPLKQASGISEEDVAKRLMDFGFHAPTMSFPVAGTLMIEPTESESLMELDRFIEAMVTIRGEIELVLKGELDAVNNPLKNAPHTLADIMDESWDRPYSKRMAAFPAPWIANHKYWPTVNRVDNVFGDRNLVCSCPATADYDL